LPGRNVAPRFAGLPLEGLRPGGLPPPRHRDVGPSHEVSGPSEFFEQRRCEPSGSLASTSVFAAFRPTRVGPSSPSPGPCERGFILSWAFLLFRVPTAPAGPPRARDEHLPRGSVPPSRYQIRESTLRQRSHRCLCSAPGVLHTLDGLLLPAPCRLVSSGYHVRGFLYRGFPRWSARRAHHPSLPSCRLAASACGRVASPAPARAAPPSGLRSSHRFRRPARWVSTSRAPHPLLRFRSFRASSAHLGSAFTAPPLMTFAPFPRSGSGAGSPAYRSVRGLLLCLQTISLFELPGHPSAACAPSGEAPTSRATLRPPDVFALLQRACHPQDINKSLISSGA
jgi:hypothetical protein